MKHYIYIVLCYMLLAPFTMYGAVTVDFISDTALVSGVLTSFIVQVSNSGAQITNQSVLIFVNGMIFSTNPVDYQPSGVSISSNTVLWNNQTFVSGSSFYTGVFTATPQTNPVLRIIQLSGGFPTIIQTVLIVPDSSYYTASTPQNTLLAFDGSFGIADLSPLSITGTTNGSATIAGNIINFTPTTGFTGTASFTYSAQDTFNLSFVPASVTITVNVTPPIGTLSLTVPKTAVEPGTADTISINLNAASLPSPNPSITSDTSPANHYTISATSPAATTISGSSVAWDNQSVVIGNNIFTQSISYGAIGSPTIITITAAATVYSLTQSKQVLLAPVGSYTLSTMQNTPVNFDGTFAGLFTPANLTINSSTNGSASIALNGIITFTPNSGFFGPASFTYTDSATNITVTVTVTVIPNVALLSLANGFLSAYIEKYLTPYI